jgi:23S rRNA (cytidine1920-2'-O)/16S rRNA (cytidine1409-2'-O)-methyltransferase
MGARARPERQRLDQILVARGLAATRAKAQALVMAGRVRSEGAVLDKPGARFDEAIPLDIEPGRRYVSRGGQKLAPALRSFGLEVGGGPALDVGASTGGFTQVLLEAGFEPVVALDVGRGQLDWGLRNDPRVRPLDGFNARYLRPDDLPFRPRIVVVDVAFISLRLVLPAVMGCLADRGDAVALVKPQFEVGRGQVGRGGIVREPGLHRRVLEELCDFAVERSWRVAGLCASEIRGADGNREFFLHLCPGGEATPRADLSHRIATLTDQLEEVEG